MTDDGSAVYQRFLSATQPPRKPAPEVTTLTPLCGPHCCTKDGVTSHCGDCHVIQSRAHIAMTRHLDGEGT